MAKINKVKTNDRRFKIIRIISIFCFFSIWQSISSLNLNFEWFNPVFLPGPLKILKVGYNMFLSGSLIKHLSQSLLRVLAGFMLGSATAVLMGIIITRSKYIESIIEPIFNMIGPIPAFAFLPMMIIWFGIGELSKIVLIAFAAFFPILTYTVDGIKSINPVLIRSALSLGANKIQIFSKIIMKSALPNIIVGMKVSLALTFSALVVAEMMGADRGLGFIIMDARNWFKISNMLLAAALIGIEYTIFHSVITVIEKALFKWRKGGMSDAVES